MIIRLGLMVMSMVDNGVQDVPHSDIHGIKRKVGVKTVIVK